VRLLFVFMPLEVSLVELVESFNPVPVPLGVEPDTELFDVPVMSVPVVPEVVVPELFTLPDVAAGSDGVAVVDPVPELFIELSVLPV